ncbi:MAG: membrane protein insertase YidC [Alphaproteobacteria bacterium]|nr:membrane protein insertase YidC [Alphaproteobacteria bacterium]
MTEDLKSFYIAIVLSALVVVGVNYFMPQAEEEQTIAQEVADIPTPVVDDTQNSEVVRQNNIVTDEQSTKKELTEVSFEDVSTVLAKDARLPVENDVLSGSIRLKGARFDHLLLTKYKQTLDEDSSYVELFKPAKTQNYFFSEYGWLSADSKVNVPNSNSVWSVIGNQRLTADNPVKLEWHNGQGLKFIQDISVDENYLFTVKQTVENNSGTEITLLPYGLLSKNLDKESIARSVVHEGFTGVFDGKLQEIKFSSMDEKGKSFETTGGWISLTDKYWLGSFIFSDTYQAKVNVRQIKEGTFQLDFKGMPMTVQSGSSVSVTSKIFAGAKEIKLLDTYAKDINKFDLNVDFGWYYFLTKPFFYALDFLYGFLGNMGWAILLFAAILRLCMFPIANKSYVNMSKMKKIQPKVMALQALYKDDKATMQRATMELYKREKVNPAAGCLPMFIQIPIFFSLYKVLNIAIELRHAPFIGWVKDLSAPDPLTISVWSHIPLPSMLDVGVWPLIYGLTMLIQNRLNPQPANKDQARMFMLLPIVFTIMFAHFAVGLVIYWILNNVLSLIQQKIIMYKNGVK